MLPLGIILMVIAGLLVWSAQKKKSAAFEMRVLERRNAGDLVELHSEIAGELGEGAFEEAAEIVGAIECEAPLTSPLGGRPCVYYSMVVSRKYEEEYWDKDMDGDRVRKTRTATETVAANNESTTFYVTDASGKIMVDPPSARWDGMVQTVSEFQPTHGQISLNYGSWNYQPAPITGDRRELGYQYQEEILPLDRRLTVLGTVNDKMGQLALRNGEKHKLVISTRSREDMVKGAQSTAKTMLIIGAICGIGGLVMTIVGAIG